MTKVRKGNNQRLLLILLSIPIWCSRIHAVFGLDRQTDIVSIVEQRLLTNDSPSFTRILGKGGKGKGNVKGGCSTSKSIASSSSSDDEDRQKLMKKRSSRSEKRGKKRNRESKSSKSKISRSGKGGKGGKQGSSKSKSSSSSKDSSCSDTPSETPTVAPTFEGQTTSQIATPMASTPAPIADIVTPAPAPADDQCLADGSECEVSSACCSTCCITSGNSNRCTGANNGAQCRNETSATEAPSFLLTVIDPTVTNATAFLSINPDEDPWLEIDGDPEIERDPWVGIAQDSEVQSTGGEYNGAELVLEEEGTIHSLPDPNKLPITLAPTRSETPSVSPTIKGASSVSSQPSQLPSLAPSTGLTASTSPSWGPTDAPVIISSQYPSMAPTDAEDASVKENSASGIPSSMQSAAPSEPVRQRLITNLANGSISAKLASAQLLSYEGNVDGSRWQGQNSASVLNTDYSRLVHGRSLSDSVTMVPLAEFHLEFHLKSPPTSTSAGLQDVVALTNAYLEEYMMKDVGDGAFRLKPEATGIDLLRFNTSLVSYVSGQDDMSVQLKFQSTAVFSNSSTAMPTFQELNQALSGAFNGKFEDAYLDLVHYLPSNSIFRETSDIKFYFFARGIDSQESSSSITFSHYTLDYVTFKGRSVSAIDVFELQELTNMYLRSFVLHDLRLSSSMLAEFSTSVVEHWQSGEASRVQYESTARFKRDSPVTVPTVAQLDVVRIKAFSDEYIGGYLDILDALPESDMFSSTSTVHGEETHIPTPNESFTRLERFGFIAVVLAIVAVKLLLILACIRCKKSRKQRLREDYEGNGNLPLVGDSATVMDASTDYNMECGAAKHRTSEESWLITALGLGGVYGDASGQSKGQQIWRDRTERQDEDEEEEEVIEFSDTESEVSSLSNYTDMEDQSAAPMNEFQVSTGRQRVIYYKARKVYALQQECELATELDPPYFSDQFVMETPDVQFLGHFS